MLSEKLKEMGVVGAGGAGFPTYVKASSEVEFVIANGAECEPLIHKDAEMMEHFPAEMVSGLQLMMQATKARQGNSASKRRTPGRSKPFRRRSKRKRSRWCCSATSILPAMSMSWSTRPPAGFIPPAGIPLQVATW